MGKNTRARRAAKQRERDRGSGSTRPDPRRYQPADQADTSRAATIEQRSAAAVVAALDALARRDGGHFERCVDQLEVSGPRRDGLHAGSVAVLEMLEQQVARLWPAGWQPRDVERYVRREQGAAGALVAIDAMAAEHVMNPHRVVDPRWSAQLDVLEARLWWQPTGGSRLEQRAEKSGFTRHESLGLTISVLGLLMHAPKLRTWMPYPGAPAHVVESWARATVVPDSIDRKMLERVRALLAKAESTTFPEEAEALTTKAQHLMARHAIDAAFVRAQTGGRDVPGARRIAVDDPYSTARATLIHVVASANRCKSIWSKELGFTEVLGFEVDLDIVELLSVSLLVQATAVMLDAGRQSDRNGTSRTRSFRQSFLVAFANRIGERLRKATQTTVHEAAAEHGAALLPVLASREAAVKALVDETYSRLRTVGTSVTNEHGWHAGRAAADRADIGENNDRLPRGA